MDHHSTLTLVAKLAKLSLDKYALILAVFLCAIRLILVREGSQKLSHPLFLLPVPGQRAPAMSVHFSPLCSYNKIT